MQLSFGFYWQVPYAMMLGWESYEENNVKEFHAHFLIFSMVMILDKRNE